MVASHADGVTKEKRIDTVIVVVVADNDGVESGGHDATPPKPPHDGANEVVLLPPHILARGVRFRGKIHGGVRDDVVDDAEDGSSAWNTDAVATCNTVLLWEGMCRLPLEDSEVVPDRKAAAAPCQLETGYDSQPRRQSTKAPAIVDRPC